MIEENNQVIKQVKKAAVEIEREEFLRLHPLPSHLLQAASRNDLYVRCLFYRKYHK